MASAWVTGSETIQMSAARPSKASRPAQAPRIRPTPSTAEIRRHRRCSLGSAVMRRGEREHRVLMYLLCVSTLNHDVFARQRGDPHAGAWRLMAWTGRYPYAGISAMTALICRYELLVRQRRTADPFPGRYLRRSGRWEREARTAVMTSMQSEEFASLLKTVSNLEDTWPFFLPVWPRCST
jgi:hypothetical protein